MMRCLAWRMAGSRKTSWSLSKMSVSYSRATRRMRIASWEPSWRLSSKMWTKILNLHGPTYVMNSSSTDTLTWLLLALHFPPSWKTRINLPLCLWNSCHRMQPYFGAADIPDQSCTWIRTIGQAPTWWSAVKSIFAWYRRVTMRCWRWWPRDATWLWSAWAMNLPTISSKRPCLQDWWKSFGRRSCRKATLWSFLRAGGTRQWIWAQRLPWPGTSDGTQTLRDRHVTVTWHRSTHSLGPDMFDNARQDLDRFG